MSEKIDMSRNTTGWVGYFILEALGENVDIMLDKNFNPESVDVKLTINGIEFPVESSFESMGKQFEKMAEERAKELIQEKFDESLFDNLGDIVNLTERLKDELQDKVNDMYSKKTYPRKTE